MRIDDTLILKKRKEFEEAPDFSLPLNVYFKNRKIDRSWQQKEKSQSMKQTWSCNFRPTSDPQG